MRSHDKHSKSFNVEAYVQQLRSAKDGAGSTLGVVVLGRSDMALAMRASPIKAILPRSTLIEIGKEIHQRRVAFYSILDALLTEYSLDEEAISKVYNGNHITDEDRSRSRNADLDHWTAVSAGNKSI
ncbi:hypothetical protein [Pseudorhizobium pelagicum]|uniref:hypothetical protein n=1 Tax=Pseudorhizobium pelagicum TaxID=1509405 RepID=UPI00111146D9|nr:hypothetical protein [Pseudorhizobium pelagicum]